MGLSLYTFSSEDEDGSGGRSAAGVSLPKYTRMEQTGSMGDDPGVSDKDKYARYVLWTHLPDKSSDFQIIASDLLLHKLFIPGMWNP